MRRLLMATVMLGMMAAGRTETRADLIASNTAGNLTSSASYFGQSFTTAAGPLETNITFNFFSNSPATTPFAIGTGFLLRQAYTGTPAGLSTSTAGYLGMATASGGLYSFGSAVTLTGGTQYFFYENAVIAPGAITGGNIIVGANDYFTNSSTTSFTAVTGSTNFAVNGTTVPEPASALMFGLGLATTGLVCWHRSRRRMA